MKSLYAVICRGYQLNVDGVDLRGVTQFVDYAPGLRLNFVAQNLFEQGESGRHHFRLAKYSTVHRTVRDFQIDLPVNPTAEHFENFVHTFHVDIELDAADQYPDRLDFRLFIDGNFMASAVVAIYRSSVA